MRTLIYAPVIFPVVIQERLGTQSFSLERQVAFDFILYSQPFLYLL